MAQLYRERLATSDTSQEHQLTISDIRKQLQAITACSTESIATRLSAECYSKIIPERYLQLPTTRTSSSCSSQNFTFFTFLRFCQRHSSLAPAVFHLCPSQIFTWCFSSNSGLLVPKFPLQAAHLKILCLGAPRLTVELNFELCFYAALQSIIHGIFRFILLRPHVLYVQKLSPTWRPPWISTTFMVFPSV